MSLRELDAGSPAAPRTAWDAASGLRWRRLRALASDLAVLVAAEILVAALAVIWLVARTDAGRVDIGDGDAAMAMALLAGVVPAWLAWLALHSLEGATRGQRRAGLMVEARRRRDRLYRLALEPRGLFGWLWLAALLWLGEVFLIRWVGAFALALAAGLVIASAAQWLVRPNAAPLHDRIARTRVVRR